MWVVGLGYYNSLQLQLNSVSRSGCSEYIRVFYCMYTASIKVLSSSIAIYSWYRAVLYSSTVQLYTRDTETTHTACVIRDVPLRALVLKLCLYLDRTVDILIALS